MTIAAACLVLVLSAALDAAAGAPDETAAFFRANCTSCHTIGGGRLTGPDLKDVASRKDPAWLARFVANPKAMIDAGDPYAAQLLKEARGVIMPSVPGVTAERARALLDLIASESQLERSQFAGLEVPDTPFSPEDVALGRRIFTGLQRLPQQGPSCASCHTTRSLGTLGGGRLGPDLTRAYERLGGRKGLATWLTAPATVTMQALFRGTPLQGAQILPLVAFLEAEAKEGGQADTVAQLSFLLMGLGGAVVVLGAFGAIWGGRFRAVRRPMVRGDEERGEA
ncbi:MAG: cytochrome c [Candidatus Latescibacterota bacterium]